MERSKRLETILSLVPEGCVPADIGTDHGFLPIELIRRGIVSRAFAMDVREGPLDRAREHTKEAGMTGQIQLRLSDGFAALSPGEADAAVIAGMGGGLTVRLLNEGLPAVKEMKALILSPHSEAFKVRRWLRENGWRIEAEELCREEDKFYPAFRAVPGQEEEEGRFSRETEDAYGPLLLRRKDETLREFVNRRLMRNEQILAVLPEAEKTEALGRREELKEERRILLELKTWLETS